MSVLSLTACRTAQTATDNVLTRTAARQYRDSVYVHDSVQVRIRADTVYMERWHTRWRDRETVRTDTVQVEKRTTETIQVRYIPTFYKYCAAFAIIFALYLLVRIVLYLFKRFNF